MHLYDTTTNYHSYKIRELIGMVKMLQEASFEEGMMTVLERLRQSAIIFLYVEIRCISYFAAAFNELKEKRLVTTEEIDMLSKFFTTAGFSRDDINTMLLH